MDGAVSPRFRHVEWKVDTRTTSKGNLNLWPPARFLWRYVPDRRIIASWSGSQNSLRENAMALVHHTDRVHDLSLIGLVLVVFGIIAVAAFCVRLVMDQVFSLFW